MYSTDGGKTWTKGDSFTVNEDVTVQVKAVKDGAESEIATFTYTVKEEVEPLPRPPSSHAPDPRSTAWSSAMTPWFPRRSRPDMPASMR